MSRSQGNDEYFQRASAFKRGGCLIINSNVKTVSGLWFLRESCVVLDASAALSDIGYAVLRKLAESQTGLSEPPDPKDLEDTLKRMLKAAGVHSYRRFVAGALHCGVGRHANSIEISPTHNGGLRGDAKGFHLLPERRKRLEADVSPQALGSAFLQGFAACTAIYE